MVLSRSPKAVFVLAERLVEARVRAGYSPETAAKAAGVSEDRLLAWEQDEDKPLAPRDWLNKAIDALQYGGLAAFDWYTWEQDVKPRRSYCGSYDLVGQAPTGLDPYLVMSRAFGGRETGLYVFQRTP